MLAKAIKLQIYISSIEIIIFPQTRSIPKSAKFCIQTKWIKCEPQNKHAIMSNEIPFHIVLERCYELLFMPCMNPLCLNTISYQHFGKIYGCNIIRYVAQNLFVHHKYLVLFPIFFSCKSSLAIFFLLLNNQSPVDIIYMNLVNHPYLEMVVLCVCELNQMTSAC